MRTWKYRLGASLVALVMCVGMARFVASCALAEPKTEQQADEMVRQMREPERIALMQLLAEYDIAVASEDPTDDAPALAALEAAEDNFVRSRAEETGSDLGSILGFLVPHLGPLGSALGLVVAGNLLPVLSNRGRALVRQAIRDMGPSSPGSPGAGALADAIRAILAAAGWGHSTPASAAAAEKTLGQPPAVVATVKKAVVAAAPEE